MHPRAEMQERAIQIQLRPDPAQMSAGVPVVKRDFVPQITLMAPPIVFSTRLRPSAECDTRYSSNFVENMSFKALQHHCGGTVQMPEQPAARQHECERVVLRRTSAG